MSEPPPTQVDTVEGLVRLERVRAWAYTEAVAGDRLGSRAQVVAAGYAEHSRSRAAAMRSGLEALGGGLSGLKPLDLRGEPIVAALAEARDEPAVLRIFAQLERVAIDTYARGLARLEIGDLVQSAASAMGAHAQQLAALRTALGEDPV